MRVFIRVLIRDRVEAPYTVVSRNAMRELVGDQPLKHAVDGDAIDRQFVSYRQMIVYKWSYTSGINGNAFIFAI